MPRRNDLHSILIVGSGPIIIGQACEFDYSGAQACKALKADGYEVVVINSNPATIMTDPDLADRTYVEPLDVAYAEEVIRRERPDALLSTVGGQTGLNLSVDLAEAGVLDKYGKDAWVMAGGLDTFGLGQLMQIEMIGAAFADDIISAHKIGVSRRSSHYKSL